MTPYYPVCDGHPSMFASKDSAVVVSEVPIFSIYPTPRSADGANHAARLIHNARMRTTSRKGGPKPLESMLAPSIDTARPARDETAGPRSRRNPEGAQHQPRKRLRGPQAGQSRWAAHPTTMLYRSPLQRRKYLPVEASTEETASPVANLDRQLA
jgi:hypothetical protein